MNSGLDNTGWDTGWFLSTNIDKIAEACKEGVKAFNPTSQRWSDRIGRYTSASIREDVRAGYRFMIKVPVLSPRRLEVLRLVAEGHTNQEIADALFISLSTTKNHVEWLLKATGVKRRTALIAWAWRHGFIS